MSKLQETINDKNSNELTKEVYKFVYDNLKNGASVLRQMKLEYDLDRQKYMILKQFYDKFMIDAKQVQEKLESSKQEKILANIQKREVEKLAREEAMKKSGKIYPQDIDEADEADDNYKVVEQQIKKMKL